MTQHCLKKVVTPRLSRIKLFKFRWFDIECCIFNLPSTSTSLIISSISSSVGLKPKHLMTVTRVFEAIVPSPFLSNIANAVFTSKMTEAVSLFPCNLESYNYVFYLFCFRLTYSSIR